MRRGWIVLVLAAALGLAALVAVPWIECRSFSAADWVCHEFGLAGAQASQVAALEKNYQAACAGMCARIAQAEGRLASLLETNHEATPEVEAAIAATDAVRTECRAHMLRHFHEVAALLPPENRDAYLGMVLPTVRDPGGMLHGQ